MTRFRPKLWTSLGAALIGAGALAACGDSETGAAGEGSATPAASAATPAGEGGEGGAEGGGPATGEAGAEAAYTGVPEASRAALRLAHLKGFFLAAQPLMRRRGPRPRPRWPVRACSRSTTPPPRTSARLA